LQKRCKINSLKLIQDDSKDVFYSITPMLNYAVDYLDQDLIQEDLSKALLEKMLDKFEDSTDESLICFNTMVKLIIPNTHFSQNEKNKAIKAISVLNY